MAMAAAFFSTLLQCENSWFIMFFIALMLSLR